MTLLELMKKVDSIPKLMAAMQKAQAASRRIQELADEAVKQFKLIEEQSKEIGRFFGEEIKLDPPTLTEETILPEIVDKTLLPPTPPARRYEKVIAIIKAAPQGVSFPELVEVWKSLEWDDWHSDKLEQKLRDAIKTARTGKKINIQHSGGHGGKFTIK